MDTSEATRIVMSRVQSFDPENASKIMGYILIQDQGEKEMIRLAFSPDALLLSYINQAKIGLGISSNTPPANPFPYPIRPPENPFPQTSPRIMIPNNGGFHLSSSSSSSFQRSRPRPILHEFLHYPVQDEIPYLDDSAGVDPMMSPSGNSDSLVFPYGEDAPSPHRRSCSVNDAAGFLDEGNGGLWRPCMYFSRGFCKNGGSCKFLHGGDVDAAIDVGSPSFDELFKLKALQQQRFSFMMSESPRNEFSHMGFNDGSSSSRQIYLTFPADSTFKEDDVSCYFSSFGPVQDVRIPYQQKRMFGFVTFVFPETVKLILAKGNPHFVCDSRVLVKPYKEKGKIREKKHHLERGEYSGIDSSDHFGQPFGPRMLLSPRELRLRKLEREIEMQQAIELQGQRMMSLQLRDLNHDHPCLHNFPPAPAYTSPRPSSQSLMNQHFKDSEESDGADDKSSALNQEKADDFDPHQSSSPLTVASLKSCYLQIPRFSSAHEVVEM
ncbi:hypothetical protein ACS0TY_005359 [Phlomoides rotata]